MLPLLMITPVTTAAKCFRLSVLFLYTNDDKSEIASLEDLEAATKRRSKSIDLRFKKN